MFVQKKHVPMKSDIKEKDDKYILEIDLPGFQKEDIKAYTREGYLIVSAEKHEEEEKSTGKLIRRERYFGKYQRSYFVGKGITEEDIKAFYRHGVLKLEVMKEPLNKKLPESKIDIV